ncbi:dTDP-4-dehydrorhamnose 3,5-epimerase [Candidatus Kinetoplastibacterium desouzaii TCC079E]|uniref:dTDP-4-dehydrorhamnose 3,5-epimerase n=1 Tax=Candidatus Kinetoplastidibacterium desouzai TCC079E TaxID=1208919 RepID=M1LRC3_9PROT|nr:dTDP-4-dehydrorhamnose 3,5-epimerase [Candidatus Kinetoplastibacterium desouzaii]AGF46706.1 dTDP-4-dehydrorhamnose 3,5-epimerase [Candidatus Kinetoplastibacterium desouzaii TCC079E]
MIIKKLPISDALIIKPKMFIDNRGYFFESFNLQRFNSALEAEHYFVQDNISFSRKNVLRGMHFQEDKPQSKLIQVIDGKIFDVIIDIRRKSSTFGKWTSVILDSQNNYQLWVPEGFAHGFLVLSNYARIFYKTTQFYYPKLEKCLLWNDKKVNIKWPKTKNLIISTKDQNGENFESLF